MLRSRWLQALPPQRRKKAKVVKDAKGDATVDTGTDIGKDATGAKAVETRGG